MINEAYKHFAKILEKLNFVPELGVDRCYLKKKPWIFQKIHPFPHWLWLFFGWFASVPLHPYYLVEQAKLGIIRSMGDWSTDRLLFGEERPQTTERNDRRIRRYIRGEVRTLTNLSSRIIRL